MILSDATYVLGKLFYGLSGQAILDMSTALEHRYRTEFSIVGAALTSGLLELSRVPSLGGLVSGDALLVGIRNGTSGIMENMEVPLSDLSIEDMDSLIVRIAEAVKAQSISLLIDLDEGSYSYTRGRLR